MLPRLLAAEWLKLWRRPIAWVLLGIFLGLLALYLTLWFLVVALHIGAFTGGNERIMLLADAQIAELRNQLTFPGIFGAVLGQFNSIGGLLAIILAAGALGSDYSWGTLRILLTRAPDRGAFLLAKTLAIFLALAAGLLIALLLGAALGAIFTAVLGDAGGGMRGRDLLALPLGIVRALYVVLPYVMATLACAALGRSVLAGVGGGLLFLAVDVTAGSLNTLAGINPLLRTVTNLLLQPNINTLVVQNGRLFGLDQTVLVSGLDLNLLPPWPQAVLVIGIYSALFFFSALRTLKRHDIGGAG
jgi:ABC-type transport system involved in multi-copper enzyme maturation permease subunit